MSRILLTVLLAAGIGACASQKRSAPPAPVITAGTPPETQVTSSAGAPTAPSTQPSTRPSTQASSQPADQPSASNQVEVYAYRPPGSTPDGAPGAATEDAGAAARAPGSAGGTEVVAYAPALPPTPSLSPAAEILVRQAEQQRQARDYVGAAATLERALGIQPQEAYIWNRLARVRTEQGLFDQAYQLALRSNVLAGDQVVLKKDNWRMIAAARRAAGDTAGALEAERKAH